MRITALVENETRSELKTTHGLSLYVETRNHKILFDLGPDDTLLENARKRDIDLSQVDTVIISHGHYDHGGALSRFLQINSAAKVYVQRQAFQPYFGKFLFLKKNIGLEEGLANHPQVILLDGDHQIDEELRLFIVTDKTKCHSKANDSLYEGDQRDEFRHEQNLIIQENQNVLIIGCGHTGVVNILEKAEKYQPKLCVGGYHLFNPATKRTVSEALLDDIAKELSQYADLKFYTCHCTGPKAFQYLSDKLLNMSYLHCGDMIEA